MKLYWYAEPNFGDALNRHLLPHYGAPVEHARGCGTADAVGLGSILGFVPDDFAGAILGPGFMWQGSSTRFPHAEVVALRGRLTAERCGAARRVLGDPGLLADRLLSEPPPTRFALGLIPHYVDFEDARVRGLAEREPHDVRIINVRKPPLEVLRQIAGCGAILSSSLHGLVAADALGIPSRWIQLSDRVAGRGFKFRDYYSAFGPDAADRATPETLADDEPLSALIGKTLRPAPAVPDVQAALDEAFARVVTERGWSVPAAAEPS